MDKVRIYGKTVNTWTTYDIIKDREYTTQYEVAYTDYFIDGRVAGKGTEDFSPERYRRDIKEGWVFTWDGERRNKGGHRWFREEGHIKFRKAEGKMVNKLLTNKHKAEVVQIRCL